MFIVGFITMNPQHYSKLIHLGILLTMDLVGILI
jgi:hypothetical protein